jgi:transcriptional regulator with XRE-family HTH domain
MALSPAQSRAARGLVTLSQVKLAKLANVSQSMIRDFEKGRRMPTNNDLEALRRSLEAKGVIFVEGHGDGDGPGVRLRKSDDVIREPGIRRLRGQENDPPLPGVVSASFRAGA